MHRLGTMLLLHACTANAASLQLDGAYLRETEKKHARVAMLAVPALLVLGAQGVDAPVSWLSHQPLDAQLEFFSAAGVLEAWATLPRYQARLRLKDTVEPGNFLPAAWRVPEPLDRAEDMVGRAAMLCASTLMLSELSAPP